MLRGMSGERNDSSSRESPSCHKGLSLDSLVAWISLCTQGSSRVRVERMYRCVSWSLRFAGSHESCNDLAEFVDARRMLSCSTQSWLAGLQAEQSEDRQSAGRRARNAMLIEGKSCGRRRLVIEGPQ